VWDCSSSIEKRGKSKHHKPQISIITSCIFPVRICSLTKFLSPQMQYVYVHNTLEYLGQQNCWTRTELPYPTQVHCHLVVLCEWQTQLQWILPQVSTNPISKFQLWLKYILFVDYKGTSQTTQPGQASVEARLLDYQKYLVCQHDSLPSMNVQPPQWKSYLINWTDKTLLKYQGLWYLKW